MSLGFPSSFLLFIAVVSGSVIGSEVEWDELRVYRWWC